MTNKTLFLLDLTSLLSIQKTRHIHIIHMCIYIYTRVYIYIYYFFINYDCIHEYVIKFFLSFKIKQKLMK